MTISQEVKDWHERSEALAAEIDAHLNSYPGPERSRINSSKNVVIYLGNRYTLITGFIPPAVIAGNLKIGDGLKDKREQLQQDIQQGSRLTHHRFKP